MYGMVNKFISTTVINRYGQEKWDEIENQLPFASSSIVEMQPYDDELTFGMVGKAVEVLDVDATEFLHMLGRDWVRETSKGPYKDMYGISGDQLFDFLKNLNAMHQAIGAQMVGLKPPAFLCQQMGENQIIVRYFSEREGLTSFVTGLLQGACEYFGEKGTVRVTKRRSDQQKFDEFEIVTERA